MSMNLAVPPWERVGTPGIQTITGNGQISLVADVTHLNQSTPSADGGDYQVTLPNGTTPRQIKRVYVTQSASAHFTVSGQFANGGSLRFYDIAQSAVLEWDGTNWHLIGGNAEEII